MCTVTYIPFQGGCFLSSNRDEKKLRKPALVPALYHVKSHTLLYPKDAEAGGAWIALQQNGNAAVLLNGGFVKHTPQAPYVKSRGLIFLDIVAAPDPLQSFSHLSLESIEPFTVILLVAGTLSECRWDGKLKYYTPLEADQPHIWSSVTLYDDAMIRKREQWFTEWLHRFPLPSMEEVLRFHHFGGEGDLENDIRMNRSNTLLTVSVTGMEIRHHSGKMYYHDLSTGLQHTYQLLFQQQIPAL